MRAPRPLAVLVVGLGVAQLLAWGTLYYAIAVIGAPARAALHLTEGELYGAFTWALLLSGALAPWAGRLVDRHGGRAVLVASALLGAGGFMTLARAESLPLLIAGWSLNGLAMALGLYDTCFAALGQVEPRRHRQAVTGVTLLAGFASTVSWPASHHLLRAIGWRSLCDAYAAALVGCAALYVAVLPRVARAVSTDAGAREEGAPLALALRRRAQLIALAFAGASLVSAAVSAHLPSLLRTLEVPGTLAVWTASSIGATQVLGRLLELAFGSRYDAARLALVTFGALCVALALLLAVAGAPWLAAVFALVYGLANGLLTIAKATLCVELLGSRNLGAALGAFSAPSLLARAVAPLGFAVAAAALGTRGALLGLVAVGAAALAALVAATGAPGSARALQPAVREG